MKKVTIVIGLLSLLLLSPFACEKARVEREAGLSNGEFNATLNGFPIFYAVHGKGPVLMTMPNSWGLSHEGLRSLYMPLEEHLTMVYFDPRGMGRSGEIRQDSDMSMAAIRADFDALRLYLGLGKVNAIGWSNGGMNLLLYAAGHPEALSSAIIVHSLAHWGEEDVKYFAKHHPGLLARYNEFMTMMAGDELSDVEKEAKYREFSMNESFPAMLADSAAGRPMLDEFFRSTDLSWRHSLYSESVDSPTFDARPHLAGITVPTLVIAGVHDLMPISKAEEIAKGIPDARLVVFERSGHFSQFEEREKFVRTVLEFLGVGA